MLRVMRVLVAVVNVKNEDLLILKTISSLHWGHGANKSTTNPLDEYCESLFEDKFSAVTLPLKLAAMFVIQLFNCCEDMLM